MLRLLHALVFALVAVFGIASGAHALGSETALRRNFESAQDHVGGFASQALGTRQQNPAVATVIASECSYAARGAPRFTQTTASALFKNGPFAGKSIGEVAAGLRSGAINPSQLPIDVIVRNGQTLALNTRSSLALTRAGIDPSKWTMVNRTGDAFFEKLLTERLARNGLTEAGTEVLRITGMGQNASAIW